MTDLRRLWWDRRPAVRPPFAAAVGGAVFRPDQVIQVIVAERPGFGIGALRLLDQVAFLCGVIPLMYQYGETVITNAKEDGS